MRMARWQLVVLVLITGAALAYMTMPLSPLAANLLLAAIAGLVGGAAFLPSRRAQVRSESQLVALLGSSLLAARPSVPQALAPQLLAHWFRRGRPVLPVVSAESGTGSTRTVAELGRALAALGERTLLIDADFRSPRLHAEFRLPNRRGLADFLEGRAASLIECADNLSVLVAGRSRADPLELLSDQRVQALLAVAAQRYRVVLVDTPAAACGPDLQLFAAFGGGALVVARRRASPHGLQRLRKLLVGCKAQVVGTVIAAT
jgi:Mrp family chromosome partitioning ATPase